MKTESTNYHELKNGLMGWYSYDEKTGVIVFHEEYIPNEDDDRLWFHISAKD